MGRPPGGHVSYPGIARSEGSENPGLAPGGGALGGVPAEFHLGPFAREHYVGRPEDNSSSSAVYEHVRGRGHAPSPGIRLPQVGLLRDVVSPMRRERPRGDTTGGNGGGVGDSGPRPLRSRRQMAIFRRVPTHGHTVGLGRRLRGSPSIPKLALAGHGRGVGNASSDFDSGSAPRHPLHAREPDSSPLAAQHGYFLVLDSGRRRAHALVTALGASVPARWEGFGPPSSRYGLGHRLSACFSPS